MASQITMIIGHLMVWLSFDTLRAQLKKTDKNPLILDLRYIKTKFTPILLKPLYAVCIVMVWQLTLQVRAQTPILTERQADSLRRIIHSNRHDTVKITAMNNLSKYVLHSPSLYDSAFSLARNAYLLSEKTRYHAGVLLSLYSMATINAKRGRYNEAIEYYQKVYQLAEIAKNTEKIAVASNDIGTAYWRQGKYPKALEYYTKSLKIFKEIGTKTEIAVLLNNIGNVHEALGNRVEALEYYLQSLRSKEALGNQSGIAASLNNIANIYALQGHYTDALSYHFRALQIKEELGNKGEIATTLNNIASVYFHQKDFIKALEFTIKSLRLKEALGNKNGISTALQNIGEIYAKLQRYQEALPYYFKALQIKKELGLKAAIPSTLNAIASIYLMNHEYDSALQYSFRSLTLADSLGARERKKEALENLGIIYDSLGQHQRALAYYRQYVALKDSLLNLEVLKKTTALKEGYEAEKREQQISLLNKEKELQQSDLQRKTLELARAHAEHLAQQHSILLLHSEKELRTMTMNRQEAELTAAQIREEQHKQTLISERKLQEAELHRRSVIQLFFAGILTLVIIATLWLAALYRQKLIANREILRQQKILEAQATEIQLANTELYETNLKLEESNFRLEESNSRLTEMYEEKSDILSVVAHDLKSPIIGIQKLAYSIEGEAQKGSDQFLRESSAMIQHTSERMLSLIQQLLKAHSAEFNKNALAPIELHVHDLIEITEQVVQNFSASHSQHHFQSQIEIDPSSGWCISANPLVLMQVLENLITNAITVSPNGSPIIVALYNKNNSAYIAIQDSGPGISKNDQQHLFMKFSLLRTANVSRHSSGLGLYIVKKLTEAMNGSIRCESEPGQGATFIVGLPLSTLTHMKEEMKTL